VGYDDVALAHDGEELLDGLAEFLSRRQAAVVPGQL
jgi:hypothetical protein